MNLMSPRENTKDGIKHDKKGFKNLFFYMLKQEQDLLLYLKQLRLLQMLSYNYA